MTFNGIRNLFSFPIAAYVAKVNTSGGEIVYAGYIGGVPSNTLTIAIQ